MAAEIETPTTTERNPPHISNVPPKGRKFPCPQCGAKLDFNPAEQALKCPYCGHLEEIQVGDQAIEEHDYETYLQRLADEEVTVQGLAKEVRCTGCGAIVMMEETLATDKCPFCTTHLENEPEPVHAMIPPESLLPFRLNDSQARDAFNHWIQSLWFAPTSLKQLANLGQLSGLYLPYWTFDSMTTSRYTGQRGDNYTDTEYFTTRDARGNLVTQSRNVIRTHWTPVSGQVQHFFDDVLIYASRGVPEAKVNQLTPWDLENLCPFRPEYLSGFKTERYSVMLPDGFNNARQVMDGYIREFCRRDIGGDHQHVERVWTNHQGVTFKHLLLPVWLAAYRYHDKLFQILVNARTGEVVGDRPYSYWKIFSTIFAIVLAIALILAGIAMMKGGGFRFGFMPWEHETKYAFAKSTLNIRNRSPQTVNHSELSEVSLLGQGRQFNLCSVTYSRYEFPSNTMRNTVESISSSFLLR
jgi:DNA-directed RNA polymerase subunit RPC12/RpoP